MRRFFFGLHPLCASEVLSIISKIEIFCFCKPFMIERRPLPRPLKKEEPRLFFDCLDVYLNVLLVFVPHVALIDLIP